MAKIEVLADLDDIAPHSPRWHELRRMGIGGSDAGAIVGIDHFRTPYQVWVEKVSEAIPDEQDESEAATWGKLLEAPVRDEFSRRTGLNVVRFPRMVRHIDRPHTIANVDGLVVEQEGPDGGFSQITGIYEGKTSKYDWMSDGEMVIPARAAIQGFHYMAVLDLDIVHFACLVGGQTLRIGALERNDKLIEDLLAIEEAFWALVEDGTPPEARPGDVDTLRRHWEPQAGKSVELTAELAMEIKRRTGLAEQKGQLETEIKGIDAKVMAFMGDATEATWKGVTAATWKQDAKGRLKTKDLEAAHPEIAAEFRGEPSRRFIPKEIAS